MVYNAVNPLPL